MAKLYNLARMTTASTGTGNVTLGSAVPGFLTFAQAGVASGEVISYVIEEGTNREIGRTFYLSSGPTISRDIVLKSTNSNAKISLSGNAQVFIAAAAEDLSPQTVPDQTSFRTNLFAAPYEAMAAENLVINGGMEVSQEIGSNSRSLGTGDNGVLTYNVDQWTTIKNLSGSWTIQQTTDAPPGFSYSANFTASGTQSLGVNDYVCFGQPFEGQQVARLGFGTSNFNYLTYGFWIKSSTTGSFTAILANNRANASTRTHRHLFTINAANTWEFKCLSVPGDGGGSGSWPTTNAIGMGLYLCFGAGANMQVNAPDSWDASSSVPAVPGQSYLVPTSGNYVRVTGFFAVPGPFDTLGGTAQLATRSLSFRKSLSAEIEACLRHYETSYDLNVPIASVTAVGAHDHGVAVSAAFGMPTTANAQTGAIYFRKMKRATPTIGLYSPVTGNATKARDLVNSADVSATTSSIGQRSFQWMSQPNAAGNLRLQFHWVASARL